jgi:hypothetical protein
MEIEEIDVVVEAVAVGFVIGATTPAALAWEFLSFFFKKGLGRFSSSAKSYSGGAR